MTKVLLDVATLIQVTASSQKAKMAASTSTPRSLAQQLIAKTKSVPKDTQRNASLVTSVGTGACAHTCI